MTVRVVYTAKAIKYLKILSRADARRIILKIEFYARQKDPLRRAKKLKPPFSDLYCFRVGSFRAIFEVSRTGDITLLAILAVHDRKDVYE